MSPFPVTINMLYIEALIEAVKADDSIVVLARKYHTGDQDTYMSTRVAAFLKLHTDIRKFNLNVCRTITLAVKDELSVSGFNTSETADAAGVKVQAKWAWDLWNKSHMNSVQAEVHESALSDRETFIIVDWDYVNKRSRMTHNYKYTSLDSGGDGQGCWMLYENDDVNQPAKCAVKQWTQIARSPTTGQETSAMRRTIYYPDHIEKWIYDAGWQHYIELKTDEQPAEPWPIPWKSKDGKPLGIPAIHFRNVNLTPEAWDAIPLQDAINKTLIDILASNDLTAFQMLAALGWYPTTDGEPPNATGSNMLKVGPGEWIGTTKPDAKLQVVKGHDPTALVNTLKDLVLMAAQITSTPTSRFTTTKLIASQETLKEQNMQLKKKAQDRRILFGDSWEACMDMARRVTNFFGGAGLDELVTFVTIWKDNQTIEALTLKKDLGIPEEILWAEAGYTTEQIANMKATSEYAAKIAKWDAAVNPPVPIVDTVPPESSDIPPNLVDKSKADVKPATNGEKPKGS